MTKEIEYKLGNKIVLVQVSTHSDFVDCIEDTPSPFKLGRTILSPEINIADFEKVVIKCFIEGSQRITILSNNGDSGQTICHNIVEQFVRENWSNADLKQVETINCSHFEQQYKYIITKK